MWRLRPAAAVQYLDSAPRSSSPQRPALLACMRKQSQRPWPAAAIRFLRCASPSLASQCKWRNLAGSGSRLRARPPLAPARAPSELSPRRTASAGAQAKHHPLELWVQSELRATSAFSCTFFLSSASALASGNNWQPDGGGLFYQPQGQATTAILALFSRPFCKPSSSFPTSCWLQYVAGNSLAARDQYPAWSFRLVVTSSSYSWVKVS